MDPFMSAIFGAKDVKATARVKMPTGEVRTVSLHTMPAGPSEAEFAEAAKGGVDLSVRVKADDDRVRTLSGKNVFGAAAVSATCSVLGFTPANEQERKGRKGAGADTKVKDATSPAEPTIG